jgi:hypothetical protein
VGSVSLREVGSPVFKMASRPTRTRGRGKTEGRRPVTFLCHLCCCSCSCSYPRRRRRRRPSIGAWRREMEIARAAAGVACSKEHQRIYAEWFALADPGKALPSPAPATPPPKTRGGFDAYGSGVGALLQMAMAASRAPTPPASSACPGSRAPISSR